MNVEFDRADPVRDRPTLLRLNMEYLDWIAEGVRAHFGLSLTDLLGMPAADYVGVALDKVVSGDPKTGAFYIVRDRETAVGMGGLRRVRERVGEIKRIFVTEAARGKGAGAMILDRLLLDARALGYRELLLDTGPFMTSAQRLYAAAGFVDAPPYAEAEVPVALHHAWRFMRRELS